MCLFFFFNDTATTEIYTLSLHDALPISRLLRGERPKGDEMRRLVAGAAAAAALAATAAAGAATVGIAIVGDGFRDRKSTRLNSSHANISYAVFCLKKKITLHIHTIASFF